MFSLRGKLWIGVGGLVLILLLVSGLSAYVLTRHSRAVEQVLRENYRSAVYCDQMIAAIDELDAAAQQAAWSAARLPAATNATAAEVARFDANLRLQLDNFSLPDEPRLTDELAAQWQAYKARYGAFERAGDEPERAAIYWDELLPRRREIRRVARRIGDMNMSNVASVDGRVKRMLLDVRNALLVLVVAGTLAATAVVGGAGAAVVRSLMALTRSAREIEAGNLELSVEVRSGDELGQLAEAFNAMAARLREFRQADRERLTRTQQTTQLAIDSLPDAVCVLDPAGRVEIANRTARTHFAIEPGRTLAQVGRAWLTEIHRAVCQTKGPHEPVGYRSAIQLFDAGAERFLLPRAVPMLGPQGELIGVTVILVDVTRLRYADELKNDLVSTVSHELRTPLTSVRMAVLMMTDEKLGPLTPRQRAAMNAAREDSERLYRLIENILNISRIEAGQARFQFRPVPAAEVVSQAVDPLRKAFEEKGVGLSVEVDASAGDVTADATFAGLALTNLLTNALKFSPAGAEVSVRAAAGESGVTVTVADRGPGIAPEFRDRIFDKFFRIPHPGGGPAGAGLGLAIAREIAEAHGGRVTFAPRDGGGSEFALRLPGTVRPGRGR